MKEQKKQEKFETMRNLILSLALTPEEKAKHGIKNKRTNEKENSVRLYFG